MTRIYRHLGNGAHCPGHLGSLASPIAIGGPLFGTFAGPANWWESARLVSCLHATGQARWPAVLSRHGRWSVASPGTILPGLSVMLGITARRPREGSADGIFDRRSPRT